MPQINLCRRATFAVMVVVLVVLPAFQHSQAQERNFLRWATSPVGSYGYTIVRSILKMIETELGSEYTVTIHPYPSTTLAMRFVMDGYGEIAYTADIGMTQFNERVGSFKNYQPQKSGLTHTWYAYPMESMLAVPAKTAANFKCWKDFSGKPVFYTNAGFMNWLNWQRIFKVLNYDFRHLQIDLKSNARSLQSGTIVGSAVYTISGQSLAEYWRETENRMDIRIVNPCPDEEAKLKAAGLAIAEVEPKVAFAKDVGVKVAKGVSILFGYNARVEVPEGIIYKLVRTFYKNRAALKKIDVGFSRLANNFVSMQVQGIKVNPQIPVHPGLAKFLKEHQAWNDKWKVAIGAT